MNKKILTTIGILTIVAIIGGGVWYGRNKRQAISDSQNQSVVGSENMSETKTSIISDIYNNYFKNIKESQLDNNGRCLAWEMEKKIFGLQSVEIRATKRNNQYVTDMNARLTDYFESKQFKKVGEEETVYTTAKRLEFEKNELKCSIEWSMANGEDQNSFVYEVLCAKSDKKDEENYNTFNSLINKEGNPKIFVCIDKNNGSYATGTSGSIDGGGAIWYARKKADNWEIAQITQDAPLCSKVGDFPSEVIGKCL